MKYQVLTVGNPNSGKTTLFNGLTGAKQQVGNWAGVTVEKKTLHYCRQEDEFHLTDLPGIYTLSEHGSGSLDEAIAAKAVFHQSCDLIINVVDATCLERSLYLTVQLRELGRPMLVVLNKMDVLAREQQEIDLKQLEQNLGCPVFALSAHKKESICAFKQELHHLLQQGIVMPPWRITYGAEFEQALTQLQPLFSSSFNARALAIRALEQDPQIINTLSDLEKKQIAQYHLDWDLDLHIADCRYSYLQQLCLQVRRKKGELSHATSEWLDKITLNKWLGFPIFLAVMYLMFMFSIHIGSAFVDFFDIAVGALLVDGAHQLLDDHLPVWLATLLADGLGGGIQTVATFIPVIACLYLFLAVLESSGYLSRAAFLLDKIMQKIGLPGKAFVPLVLGFGCNVPAIMATRTLDEERERKLSAAMAPFMSCGARLPVYVLFAAAFFPQSGQNLVFVLYLLGILAAVLTGWVLKHTLYQGVSEHLLMEMTHYEVPTLKNVLIKTWQKLKRFVLGAGKTIVIVVMILSFLNSLGTDGTFGHQDSESSVLAKAAQLVTPVFEPIGISQENWPATVGIITGIFAKEAVVGTLNSLYSDAQEEEETFDLLARFQEAFVSIADNLMELKFTDPLGIDAGDLTDISAIAEDQSVDTSIFGNLNHYFATGSAAFSYLIFILLYTPCVAAMGAYVREFGARYARFIAVWTMGLAYLSSLVFYQISIFAQQPMQSTLWLIAAVVLIGLVFWALKRAGRKSVNFQVKLA